MHKKAVVAGLLAPLVVAEVVETGSIRFPDFSLKLSILINDMLNANPHTHLDLETRVNATTTAPFSAVRSRSQDSFPTQHYPAVRWILACWSTIW